MVHTDRFVGKCKIKDRWQDGGYVVVEQLADWPVYKVKCLPSANKRKSSYQILHRNRLMLVPSGDDTPQETAVLQVAVAIVLNANIEPFLEKMDSASAESVGYASPLVTHQGDGSTRHVWLNGEFRSLLQTSLLPEAPKSPPDVGNNEASDSDLVSPGTESEEAVPCGYLDLGLD